MKLLSSIIRKALFSPSRGGNLEPGVKRGKIHCARGYVYLIGEIITLYISPPDYILAFVIGIYFSKLIIFLLFYPDKTDLSRQRS